MKKVLIVFLMLAMTIALIACGAKPGGDAQSTGNPGSVSSVPGNTPVSGDSDRIGLSKEDEYYVFKVSPTIRLDENSWLGVVPAGKEYRDEVDADEVDVYWTNPENFRKEADEPYVFRVYFTDIEGIEDGSYSMVLCDNDDEGVVILQFPIVIKGADLTADLSKLKVN